jgi:hypothetical protein
VLATAVEGIAASFHAQRMCQQTALQRRAWHHELRRSCIVQTGLFFIPEPGAFAQGLKAKLAAGCTRMAGGTGNIAGAFGQKERLHFGAEKFKAQGFRGKGWCKCRLLRNRPGRDKNRSSETSSTQEKRLNQVSDHDRSPENYCF